MDTVIEIVEQEINAVRIFTWMASTTEKNESKPKTYVKCSICRYIGMCM